MTTLQSTDAALYVYVAWGTQDGKPVLECDQARQAAYIAIIARTRSQFCHVLAIDGTESKVQLIIQFPPSLPVSMVVRLAQEAGSRAIAQYSETIQGRPVWRERLWERHYKTHTLKQMDTLQAQEYLRRQVAAETE